jgi:hypothetical protein
MNLSIYVSGYLGCQRKDTAHLGSTKISRFGKEQLISKTTDELLLNAAGFNTHNHIPIAALLKQGEEQIEKNLDYHSYCLLAQPVNLLLQRDSFGLSEVIKLTEVEYDVLTNELNAHFNEEGVIFGKSHTLQYWFIRLTLPINASTYSVQAVIHQNINSLLPFGHDGKRLVTIINESQMLLHDHDVNVKREAEQHAVVNSLWLSGEGELQLETTNVEAYAGEGSLLKGILAVTGTKAYLDIDTLVDSQVKQAVMTYEDASQIDWDKVFKAVQSRKVKQLEIYLPTGNATTQVILKPLDCWKFWRKSKNKNTHYDEN